MSAWRTVVLGCGFLLAVGPLAAQDKGDLKKQILGKWEMSRTVGGKDYKIQLEFADKGKMTITVTGDDPKNPKKMDGKYKFVKDDTIEAEVTVRPDEVRKETDEIKITQDTLEMKDPKGARLNKLKRVK